MTVTAVFGYLYPCHFMTGLLCDLLWADPDRETEGWGENDRGVSFTFGADVVSKFLAEHKLNIIIRSNQVLGIRGCLFSPRLVLDE